MKLTKIALLCAVALGPMTTYAATNKAGDILVRAGYTTVNPDDESSSVFVGADLGSGVGVDTSAALGINAVYFLKDNWAVELLAATPFSHDLELSPIVAADGTTLVPGGKIGETDHLPPTLSILYYLGVGNDKYHPYVGLGLNYTVFFDEGFSSDRTAQGFSNLDLDSSFGLSAQWGIDIDLNDKWVVNASMRWIDIDTDAEFTLNAPGLGINNAPGSVSVDIDPFVYSLTLGYRF